MIKNNETMIEEVARLVHEKFRDIYREANGGTRVKTTTDRDWIERHGTDQADLAKLAYAELPADWQQERWLGSKAALAAVLAKAASGQHADESFIEQASSVVHDEWLKRNIGRAEEAHKLPYEALAEEVKEKDRIFVRAALTVCER